MTQLPPAGGAEGAEVEAAGMAVGAVTRLGRDKDGTSPGERQEPEVPCHSQEVGREKG